MNDQNIDTKKSNDKKDKKRKDHNEDENVVETDVMAILRNISISAEEEDRYILDGDIGIRHRSSKNRLFNSNRGIPIDLEEY